MSKNTPSTHTPIQPQSEEATIRKILNTVGPLLALVLVYGFFFALKPSNMTDAYSIEIMLRQAVTIGIAACGVTVIIVSGGIDLSIGSSVALVTVAIGRLLETDAGFARTAEAWPVLWPLAAALAGIGVATLAGFFNGLLTTKLKIAPFITTLGTMLVLRGAAKGLADNKTIGTVDNWLSDTLLQPVMREGFVLFRFSPGIGVMLVLAVLCALFLRYTRLGRHAFAIGSNEETARLCGVPVERSKILIYAIGGAFVGVAGLMEFATIDIGDPNTQVGLELEAIAAVVIGGGSLSGGRGSILGSIVGALIISVIGFGCTAIGVPVWVQEIITGAIIVAAVTVDRLRHRRLAR